MRISTIALDKDSVRSFDSDGRLHVATSHISRAMVSPYLGHEIPGYRELGLDPDQVYQLLRAPEELAKAAATFNGVPLLRRHTPVSADDPQNGEIVGCTGTAAKFNHPFLDNELVIWSREGIDLIVSGAQQELSAGYAYRPDMTPGVYEGVRYDGVMRDIKGNHVALVERGRCGPEVIVGDEALSTLQEKGPMSKVDREIARALAAERQRRKEAAEARAFVEPWVGQVSLAQDSAVEIYRAALDAMGAKHGGTRDAAALRILVAAQPKPHQRHQYRPATFAHDRAPEGKGFADIFPGAERIESGDFLRMPGG